MYTLIFVAVVAGFTPSVSNLGTYADYNACDAAGKLVFPIIESGAPQATSYYVCAPTSTPVAPPPPNSFCATFPQSAACQH
jgi:hypothetical protein